MPADYTPDAKAVLRKNALQECGLPVGQVSIVIKGRPGFETVSFYCNKTKQHLDQCAFMSAELIISRRPR